MKKILTITLIFVLSNTCYAQSLLGKWYMIARTGLIEFTITSDSTISRQLHFDFTSKGRPVEGRSYTLVKLSDKLLLISKSERDSTKYGSMTITHLTEGKYFQFAWNAPTDSGFYSADELIAMHKKDTTPLYGFYFFSEKYIPILTKMKGMDSINLDDFKQLMRLYVDKWEKTSKEFDKINIGYIASFFNFEMATQALYESGFNPLINPDILENAFKKYAEDPDVKKILDELKEKLDADLPDKYK